MKKIGLQLLLLLFAMQVNAQFDKARLQATGLTCAMCSNAINKAVAAIPFVASVESDIKNAAFEIVFKKGTNVNIDAIKDAVEDAGFFVGSFVITGSITNTNIDKDGYAKIGESAFYFVKRDPAVLNGMVTLKVIDKPFLTSKEFKKISTSYNLLTLQNGKAAAAMPEKGIRAGDRIYHVVQTK